MHVLILEDESKVAHFLCQALMSEGYKTTWISSLEDLDGLTNSLHNFDIAIFDRLIGLDDSLGKITEFKKKFPRCAVLILSAINTPEERSHALDIGADDYMGKPYSLMELIARLRALLRRTTPVALLEKTSLMLGHLFLDFSTRKVTYQNKRIELSSKEFQILYILMKKPGQVYSKYKLLDEIWNIQLDLESNVVETTIRNVRRKLEEVSVDVKIQSKRNIGYWIEA